METVSWRDIPSLENIAVDWDYAPENPLGKRSWVRIGKNNLYLLLGIENISVTMVSRRLDETGNLLDISPAGLAVLLPKTSLEEGALVKICLLLGKNRVLSRAVIRNVRSYDGQYRVGMEFVEPAKEDASFITGLISSKAYRRY